MKRTFLSLWWTGVLLLAHPINAQMPIVFPMQARIFPSKPHELLPLKQLGAGLTMFRMPLAVSEWPAIPKNGHFGAKREYGSHDGLDFAVPRGTPVVAARSGKVIRVHHYDHRQDWGKGYGGLVELQHADGSRSWYAHLGKISVREGQHVIRGTMLALSGGKNNGASSGPHLHFMILDAEGRPQNPSLILSKKI
jgi:murein DD-endopeptidase MepM/ murein hydrolase activator NlpD